MQVDTVVCGDCLDVIGEMGNDSVDLVVTDPPYFRVKGEWWDRQWDNAASFLDWIGRLCQSWQRILKPNGSLYVFASPGMSDQVKTEIARLFNILNRIVWVKQFAWNKGDSLKPARVSEKALRRYYEAVEYIIFAEHYGADNIAKGEAGYAAKCDQLRGFLFEPLRAYLDEERQRAGISFEQVRQIVGCADGSGLPSHWFTQSQWMLPTRENYEKLRVGFSQHNHGGEYLRRDYEDLRRDYENLCHEYEDLRRPFNATPDAPYTDVWTFKTVSPYPGKHPCEKPLPLIEHIIKMSTHPDAVVADFFMGSGTTAEAAYRTQRHWYGCDISQEWVNKANQRIAKARAEMAQMEMTLP